MDTQWVLRNYQYGVASHLEIGNERAAIDQMFARNCLRNALVELQLKTKEQYRNIISSENPAAARLAEIKEELKSVRGAIKAMRMRKNGEDPPVGGLPNPLRKRGLPSLKLRRYGCEKYRTKS